MLSTRPLTALAIVWATVTSATPSAHVAPGVDSVVSPSSTAPVAVTSDSAQSADGHLFVCTDVNWRGKCSNFSFRIDKCLDLALDFYDSISSAGPDAGFVCRLFIDNNCQGDNFAVANGGAAVIPVEFNDKISSFECQPLCNGCEET